VIPAARVVWRGRLTGQGGGTKGIGSFVDGLRVTARHVGGGKDSATSAAAGRHRRKASAGVPTSSPKGTLALGYTYIDILDEENDGPSPFPRSSDDIC